MEERFSYTPTKAEFTEFTSEIRRDFSPLEARPPSAASWMARAAVTGAPGVPADKALYDRADLKFWCHLFHEQTDTVFRDLVRRRADPELQDQTPNADLINDCQSLGYSGG
jgi:hypothetical protein